MEGFVIFGAGSAGLNLIENLREYASILWIVDNDKNKWGGYLRGYRICNPEELKNIEAQTKILIASSYKDEIGKQLSELGFRENIDFWAPEVEIQLWCMD